MTGDVPGVGSHPASPVVTVSGSPTDEEIAVVIALLAGLPAAASSPRAQPRPLWSRPSGMHRRMPASGPGAWRASALPGIG